MKSNRFVKTALFLASAGTMLQFGGCVGNDFLIRFAGLGSIVSGLVNLFGGAN